MSKRFEEVHKKTCVPSEYRVVEGKTRFGRCDFCGNVGNLVRVEKTILDSEAERGVDDEEWESAGEPIVEEEKDREIEELKRKIAELEEERE